MARWYAGGTAVVREWSLLFLLLLLGSRVTHARPEPAELFIESSIHPDSPYVQQAVTYEIRLYRRSSLLQGELLLLEIPGAVVEPLGEEEPRWVDVDGTEYQLVRSRYLLFPQRSGALSLPGAAYSGWDVYARGGDLNLQVRPSPPLPEGAAWLPARSLKLEEQWKPAAGEWQQGEPVERRVIQEARGLTAAQLPPPPVAELPGVRIQTKASRFADRIEGEEPIGRREDTLIYLPLQPGPLELPALRIEWWSTLGDRPQSVTLPVHRFEVAAGRPGIQPSDTETANTAPEDQAGLPNYIGPLILALLLVAAAVLTLLYPTLRRPLQRQLLVLRFTAACRRDSPVDAWEHLAAWSRLVWESPPASPGALAARISDQHATTALWSLDDALYGRGAAAWDGPTAARAIPPALHQQRTPSHPVPSVLPNLDP